MGVLQGLLVTAIKHDMNSFFGANAMFVTALPDNELSDACIATLQASGVGAHIVRADYGRLGFYGS